MSESKTAYCYDDQGYLAGTCLINKNIKGDWVVPKGATAEVPVFKGGYWQKWNGKKWVNEKIPTTCADAISKNLTCISNGSGKHNQEVKAVLEALVAADSEHYKTVVSDDFVMSIEAIPEPTEEEKTLEREQANQNAAQQAIDDLIKQMTIADLNGDEEWKAELREEYQALTAEAE